MYSSILHIRAFSWVVDDLVFLALSIGILNIYTLPLLFSSWNYGTEPFGAGVVNLDALLVFCFSLVADV